MHQSVNLFWEIAVNILLVFSLVFVVHTNIIFSYNFGATSSDYIRDYLNPDFCLYKILFSDRE